MPSRGARRYRRKHLARVELMPPERKSRLAAWTLGQWQREARRRARHLGAPAVWALARDPYNQELAHALDPTGGLAADLDRVCAEAIAEFAGRHLVQVGRPLADRRRRERPES